MSFMERTMEATSMDLTSSLNSPDCAEDVLQMPIDQMEFDIDSGDIFTHIERDRTAYGTGPDYLSWEEYQSLESEYEEYANLNKGFEPSFTNALVDNDDNNGLGPFWCTLSDSELPEQCYIMVNPQTLRPVPVDSLSKATPTEPQALPKPYHPSQDHDYLSTKGVGEKKIVNNNRSLGEDEPDVEVWEIESFLDSATPPSPVPEKLPVYRPFKRATRRASARTADIKRREQTRKVSISNAVHVLKTNSNNKVRSRQFKRIKPKNSVETTPSQSDIEEFYSQPVRQTKGTTVTKKKTCKGRIDHSESERHRRNILRNNFFSLSDVIPKEYLRGDKVSSQISKQKILNGAKSYIMTVLSTKSSYKTQYQQNSLLRERWQKVLARLLKSLKRQK